MKKKSKAKITRSGGNIAHDLGLTAQDAVAEAWASIDGKLENYIKDWNGELGKYDGSYLGYQAEAAELIRRIERKGFIIVHREYDWGNLAGKEKI